MVGIHRDRTDPVIPFGGFSENVKYQEVVYHNKKQLTKYFVDATIVINLHDEHQHHHHHAITITACKIKKQSLTPSLGASPR